MATVASRDKTLYSLREFTDQKAGVRRLLSLPPLQHHVLRACNDPQTHREQLFNLIKYDPTLVAKILNLNAGEINSTDIQERLHGTPVHAIKQLVLAGCAERYAIYQSARADVFDMIRQQWVIALQTAFLSRSLSYQFGYQKPSQAFFAGLLHNVGKLLFQSEDIDDYFQLQQSAENEQELLDLETEQYGFHHALLGSFLANQWGLDPAVQDAIRYHHTDIDKIQDAHPLTRIVFLARTIAETPFDNFKGLLAKARQVFHVEHDELIPLVESALTQTGDVIRSLNINVPASLVTQKLVPFLPEEQAHSRLQETAKHHQLLREIHITGVIDAADTALSGATNEAELQELIIHASKALYGNSQCLFFRHEAAAKSLQGKNLLEPACVSNEIRIRTANEHSLLAQAWRSQKLQDTFRTDDEELSVIDREIINHTRSRGIICAPVASAGSEAGQQEPWGVLVFGFDTDADFQAVSISASIRYFTQKVAYHLHRIETFQQSISQVQETEKGLYTTILKRMVHEINNPLSIAQNNIHILGIKNESDSELRESLLSIQEEITRAANLLKQHLDASIHNSSAYHPVNVNELVSDLLLVFRDGFLESRDILCEQELDQTIPPVYIDDNALKQILTNLVKNAAESMDDGGWLAIHTFDQVIIGNSSYIEIQVLDDGPGVPKAIVEKLFTPVESHKGLDHSGLGLSIVKELSQAIGGFVSYRRTPGEQTLFSVYLPRATQPPDSLH